MAFLIGQAAPSARPQIVVPGMMPIVSPISSSRSRSFSRPLPALMRFEHRQRPGGSFAAGRALAAAFVLEEPATVVQEIDDRHGFVDHDHGGGAQPQAADLARARRNPAACRTPASVSRPMLMPPGIAALPCALSRRRRHIRRSIAGR